MKACPDGNSFLDVQVPCFSSKSRSNLGFAPLLRIESNRATYAPAPWRKGALAFEEEQQTVCESWCAGCNSTHGVCPRRPVSCGGVQAALRNPRPPCRRASCARATASAGNSSCRSAYNKTAKREIMALSWVAANLAVDEGDNMRMAYRARGDAQ